MVIQQIYRNLQQSYGALIHRTDNAQHAPIAPTSFSIPESVQTLIDVCTTLCIKISSQDIDRWIEEINKDSWDARKLIAKERGNEFLADCFCNIAENLSWDGRDDSPAFRDYIADILKVRLAGIEDSKFPRISDLMPAPKDYESRRTKMNTTEDRSLNLDHHVKHFINSTPSTEDLTIVDIGVGFPPLTTIETAVQVGKRAKVIGVDVTMPDLAIKFPKEYNYNYIVFYELNTESGQFQPIYVLNEDYPQSNILIYNEPQGFEKEYVLCKAEQFRKKIMNPSMEAEYVEMTKLQHEIDEVNLSRISHDPRMQQLMRFYCSSDIKADRCELLFQPVRKNSINYSNLDFRKDDFRLSSIESADVIRLGNVLLSCYYNNQEANAAIELLAPKVKNNGILIVAADDDCSLLFRKRNGKLVPEKYTLLLRNSYLSGMLDMDFCGTRGLDAILKQSLSGISNKGGVGDPMNRENVALIMERLKSKGFKTNCSFGAQTWLDIYI